MSFSSLLFVPSPNLLPGRPSCTCSASDHTRDAPPILPLSLIHHTVSVVQTQSSDSPLVPATKLARALRKPSGAIAVALEFARPGDIGPGLAVRARDSKERLQIAGSRGLSATVRQCAAAALLVSAAAGDDYTAEALVAFAQEQVRGAAWDWQAGRPRRPARRRSHCRLQNFQHWGAGRRAPRARPTLPLDVHRGHGESTGGRRRGGCSAAAQ